MLNGRRAAGRKLTEGTVDYSWPWDLHAETCQLSNQFILLCVFCDHVHSALSVPFCFTFNPPPPPPTSPPLLPPPFRHPPSPCPELFYPQKAIPQHKSSSPLIQPFTLLHIVVHLDHQFHLADTSLYFFTLPNLHPAPHPAPPPPLAPFPPIIIRKRGGGGENRKEKRRNKQTIP